MFVKYINLLPNAAALLLYIAKYTQYFTVHSIKKLVH